MASWVAAITLLIGVLVLGLKYLAYRLTGSVALYSDALESVVNVVASGVALLALRVAHRPPDANHPYGHHKAEYLSAVAEGVLIVLAAFGIVAKAVGGLQHPSPLVAPGPGLLVSALASLVNGLWAAFLLRTAARLRSPALRADGQHLLTDVLTSAGVLAGVGLAALTGWTALDPLLAILVALNILWVGWRVIRASAGGLMDEAVPASVLELVRRTVALEAEGALEAHGLRTRLAGALTYIEFHLVVPGRMTVGEAHAICDRLEAALEQQIADSQVTIHLEPESEAEHRGIVVL